jgi:hypothetical protein
LTSGAATDCVDGDETNTLIVAVLAGFGGGDACAGGRALTVTGAGFVGGVRAGVVVFGGAGAAIDWDCAGGVITVTLAGRVAGLGAG